MAKSNLKEGAKFDTEKPLPQLLSISALMGMVRILTSGAIKYAARNWEKGIAYSRCYGAILRHLFAWWMGEDLDPESGESHLHHAACEIHFLEHFEENREQYAKFDDRPITKQTYQQASDITDLIKKAKELKAA